MGIGLRLAGRMAGEQMAGKVQAAVAAPAQPSAAPPAAPPSERVRAMGQTAAHTSRGVARGVGGFLKPFRRVGGIIWLEVMGVFFLLFVLVAGGAMWRTHPASLHGPYDRSFLSGAAILVVFLYLGVSSFWRARRR